MDKVAFFIGVIVLLVATGFVFVVGGDKVVEKNSYADKCLVVSGYYWNESELACVKSGTVAGEEGRYQVDDFKKCVSAGYLIKAVYPRQCKTPRGEVFFDDAVEEGDIDNFKKCAAAGYPVMESNPRQCRTEDGTLFIEA